MTASYRVPDLPTRGAEAFLPPPPPVVTRAELSSWGLVHVIGAPGTLGVASNEAPVAKAHTAPGDVKTRGGLIDPNEFPNAPLMRPGQQWFPAVYVALPENMGPQRGALGINVEHNEDIPVPAIRIQPVALPVQRTPAMTYGRVTPNPRVFARFRSVLDPPA